jgi:hypothetical protein
MDLFHGSLILLFEAFLFGVSGLLSFVDCERAGYQQGVHRIAQPLFLCFRFLLVLP